jgi:ubiquinone/menaquinone biosynthesis C-methylase UbiE
MAVYERDTGPIKATLFAQLIRGLAPQPASDGTPQPLRLLEVGIGTGPNLAPLADARVRAGVVDGARGSSASRGEAGAPALDLVGLDPNPAMLRYAAEAGQAAGYAVAADSGSDQPASGSNAPPPTGPARVQAASPLGVEGVPCADSLRLLCAGAESLPFADDSLDAAFVTLVFCSVPDPVLALRELRRVVRPGGRLLLLEHVAADRAARPWLAWAQSALNPLQNALADGCNLNRDTAAAVAAAGWEASPVRAAGGYEWAGLGRLSDFELPGYSLLARHIAGVLVK